MEDFETLLPAVPGDRLVVVMDRPHIARQDRPDALLTWANTHAYRLGSEWLEGYELVYYAAGLPAAPGRPASAVWPTGVALTELAVPATVAPGTALPITLKFTLLRPDWAEYDRLFTNLVGPNGKVVAGQETWLGQGNPGSLRLMTGDEGRWISAASGSRPRRLRASTRWWWALRVRAVFVPADAQLGAHRIDGGLVGGVLSPRPSHRADSIAARSVTLRKPTARTSCFQVSCETATRSGLRAAATRARSRG